METQNTKTQLETNVHIYIYTKWRHRILRHCSRRTVRGHAGSILLYHLSRLRT